MISLSSGLHSNHPIQRLSPKGKDITDTVGNTVTSSRFETDKDVVLELMSANTSVTLENSTESSKHSHINIDTSLIQSQSVTAVNIHNASCIWPIRISYQPDFVEMVVTDEEMNDYWDTLGELF